VQATDPLSRAGLIRYLRLYPQLVVLVGAWPSQVDVLVVAAVRIDPEVKALLRNAAAGLDAPVVLIVAELDEGELPVVVDCRVVDILARPVVTGEHLVRSILGAGQAEADPARLLARMAPLQEARPAGFKAPTRTETEVLRLLADGHETSSIAQRLHLSERTVKKTIYAFNRRLNLRNRPHAVAHALRCGII
jgi:DNA-binding NarL/FixJ family response regulator